MLFACGGGDDMVNPTSIESTATVAATGAAQPTASASDPATEALALMGRWRTQISPGDNVTLNLRPGRYSISRGAAAGTGRMDATVGEVEFSGSDLCDGTGRYRWAITNGELTFTSITPDPCGRSEVLDGVAYTKLSP